MKFLLLSLLLFRVCTMQAQVLGNYDSNNSSHNNQHHYESLTLKPDSSFSYNTRMEFINITKEGTWYVKADTLILTEYIVCCKEKMIVEEKYNKKIRKHLKRFTVNSFQGDSFQYHLMAIGKKDTVTMWSQAGSTEIRLRNLTNFYFIVNSLIRAPDYGIKSLKSNDFKITLSTTRIFYKEKWLLRNGKIIPLGWDNNYAGYYLKKEED